MCSNLTEVRCRNVNDVTCFCLVLRSNARIFGAPNRRCPFIGKLEGCAFQTVVTTRVLGPLGIEICFYHFKPDLVCDGNIIFCLYEIFDLAGSGEL